MADSADLLQQLRIERTQREAASVSGPRGSTARRLLAGAAIAVAIAAGLAVSWWSRQPARQPLATATALPIASTPAAGAVLQATGYITARRQATVSAQITGTLTEVLIEEGDRVEKGQVLARLEDNAFRASLAAAKANALAAQAQVTQLRAQLGQAQRDARRQDDLAGRGLTPRQSAEQARTQVDAVQAQLLAQQRQADAAQAQVMLAQVNYDFTVVRAPFSGVVTEKAAQVGEIVSPLSAGGGFTRTGVGTIVDMDSLELDVDVNESYIARVKAGMPARAELDAYPDWAIPAHVIAIVPSADRGKATVKVRVALESRDARIVPEMGARVSFLEQRPAAARQSRGVQVPASALRQVDGQSVLMVVRDGHVQRRPVQATVQAGQAQIEQGLVPGEQVVLSPPGELRDGQAVTLRNPP